MARLIDTDARLAVGRAKADLQLREAELAAARAELTAARLHLQQPLHLEVALAEAESTLAEAETELASLPLQIQAAEARLRFSRQELEGKRAAGDAVAARHVQRTESKVDDTAAVLEELRLHQPYLEQQIEALRRKRDALKKQLDLKVDQSRHVAEAEAGIQVASARRDQAQLAVDAAELQLQRMVVRAPVAGRVLELLARPGANMTRSDSRSTQAAFAVASLYDPNKLQVRADVRLQDVPLVDPGQPVRIETASVRGVIEGEVLRVTSSANIQKNTLEVKVAIKSPPPMIRPEMLVQVTFLAPEESATGSESSQPPRRLLVPRQLVEEAPEGNTVWIAGAEGAARRQRVTLGNTGSAALVEVIEGLTATDKLISGGRAGLRDNQRIKITGEDSTL